MIKYCDHASYAKYGDDSSKSDTDQLMSEDQTNESSKADIKEVKAVLGEANRFSNTVGNSLYNPVSRIGDDPQCQDQKTGSVEDNPEEHILFHFLSHSLSIQHFYHSTKFY